MRALGFFKVTVIVALLSASLESFSQRRGAEESINPSTISCERDCVGEAAYSGDFSKAATCVFKCDYLVNATLSEIKGLKKKFDKRSLKIKRQGLNWDKLLEAASHLAAAKAVLSKLADVARGVEARSDSGSFKTERKNAQSAIKSTKPQINPNNLRKESSKVGGDSQKVIELKDLLLLVKDQKTRLPDKPSKIELLTYIGTLQNLYRKYEDLMLSKLSDQLQLVGGQGKANAYGYSEEPSVKKVIKTSSSSIASPAVQEGDDLRADKTVEPQGSEASHTGGGIPSAPHIQRNDMPLQRQAPHAAVAQGRVTTAQTVSPSAASTTPILTKTQLKEDILQRPNTCEKKLALAESSPEKIAAYNRTIATLKTYSNPRNIQKHALYTEVMVEVKEEEEKAPINCTGDAGTETKNCSPLEMKKNLENFAWCVRNCSDLTLPQIEVLKETTSAGSTVPLAEEFRTLPEDMQEVFKRYFNFYFDCMKNSAKPYKGPDGFKKFKKDIDSVSDHFDRENYMSLIAGAEEEIDSEEQKASSMSIEDAKKILKSVIGITKIRWCAVSCTAKSCGCWENCDKKKLVRATSCMMLCPKNKITKCLERIKRASDGDRYPFVKIGPDPAKKHQAFVTLLNNLRGGDHAEVGSSWYCFWNCSASACGKAVERAVKCTSRCKGPQIKKCMAAIEKNLDSYNYSKLPGGASKAEEVKNNLKKLLVLRQKELSISEGGVESEKSQKELKVTLQSAQEEAFKGVINPLSTRAMGLSGVWSGIKKFVLMQINPFQYYEFKVTDSKVAPFQKATQLVISRVLGRLAVLDSGRSEIKIFDTTMLPPNARQSTVDQVELGALKTQNSTTSMAIGLQAEEKDMRSHSTDTEDTNHFYQLFVASSKGGDGKGSIQVYDLMGIKNIKEKNEGRQVDKVITKGLHYVSSILFNPETGHIYAANPGNNTVTVYSTRDDVPWHKKTPIETFTFVQRPGLLMMNEDYSKLYIASMTEGLVYVLPIKKQRVYGDSGTVSHIDHDIENVTPINISSGDEDIEKLRELGGVSVPVAFSIDPHKNRLFVGISDGRIVIVNTLSNETELEISIKPKGADYIPVISDISFARVGMDMSQGRRRSSSILSIVNFTDNLIHVYDGETLEHLTDVSDSKLISPTAMVQVLEDVGTFKSYYLTLGESENGDNASRLLIGYSKLKGNFRAKLQDLKVWIRSVPRKLKRGFQTFGKRVLVYAAKQTVAAGVRTGAKASWGVAKGAIPGLGLAETALGGARRGAAALIGHVGG